MNKQTFLIIILILLITIITISGPSTTTTAAVSPLFNKLIHQPSNEIQNRIPTIIKEEINKKIINNPLNQYINLPDVEIISLQDHPELIQEGELLNLEGHSLIFEPID